MSEIQDSALRSSKGGTTMPHGKWTSATSNRAIGATTHNVNIPANAEFVSIYSAIAALVYFDVTQAGSFDANKAFDIAAGGTLPGVPVSKYAGAGRLMIRSEDGATNLTKVSVLWEGNVQT